jgi:hypothetical protein
MVAEADAAGRLPAPEMGRSRPTSDGPISAPQSIQRLRPLWFLQLCQVIVAFAEIAPGPLNRPG